MCTASGCKKCNKRHNSLLHIEYSNNVQDIQSKTNLSASTNTGSNGNTTNQESTNTNSQVQQTVSFSAHLSSKQSSEILLSTAIIHVYDKFGTIHEARALLDSASQSCFMTDSLGETLQLTRQPVQIPVIGINQAVTNIQCRVDAKIKSRFNSFSFKSSFLIVPKITANLPVKSVDTSLFTIPSNITLADNTYSSPGKIDILLGATVFYDLLCAGQVKLNAGQPIIQKTKLGWIVSGTVPIKLHDQERPLVCNFSFNQDLQNQLQKFWELEECEPTRIFTREEQACEDNFLTTYKQGADGRFLVNLPLKHDVNKLGESKQIAINRLKNMERKFMKNPDMKQQYLQFMDEYEQLGHMTLVHEDIGAGVVNYLPHHAVQKESSTTTKLRVVFDGSAKTTSGFSLNDLLMIGPKIQEDLISIILRFRLHTYVITADIMKMYRQVYINPHQRDLQRIVWRSDVNQDIKSYQLNTVTYGTSSAPFLAIRSLCQVGIDCSKEYPVASEAILKDFYVDDVLTGTNSIEKTRKLREDLENILSKNGFHLRKWQSNSEEALGNQQSLSQKVQINKDKELKTLGLIWDPSSDALQYQAMPYNAKRHVTKRIILSSISQLFDPLGLLAPIIVTAKVILQELWRLKIGWDESVPLNVYTMWMQYQESLVHINQVQFSRHVTCNQPIRIQIHGFSDASEMAYAACVFVRSTDVHGHHTVKLLCSKSRVAPLKRRTLPQLELCGALLVAKLVKVVMNSWNAHIDQIYYWCDSTITLNWIAGEPSNWKTFVANRVNEIQELTQHNQWRHIDSKENPADMASRGTNVNQLLQSKLWFSGPDFLTNDQEYWPKNKIIKIKDIPERKKRIHVVLVNAVQDCDIFERFSSFLKLQRVVAYILRFKNNTLNKGCKQVGFLTLEELDKALTCLIKLTQLQSFPDDIDSLKNKKLKSTSKLISLNPFLDSNDIIRVGGRLSHSQTYEFSQKHPILLPTKHPFTRSLIRYEHYRLLHAGVQCLLATIRTKYWPISGKSTVKNVLKTCTVCFRTRPPAITQIMGNLPAERITPARPFLNTGVDYAGPFMIKTSKLRNSKLIKSYLCIFICLCTKAVHLEVVSDLSTDSFLNCLKRFISRRGKPFSIWSDNGTNFVGARNEFREFLKFLKQNEVQSKITNYLSSETIQWKLIPPRAPHFGGLWEAAVRIAKGHLRRVIGNLTLTLEEFLTVVVQTEAIMNSRPLTPLSSDPTDFEALTPGHFLIGHPLTSIPESDLREEAPNRLTKYRQLTQAIQHFWTRWSKEYIGELQQRTKWKISYEQQLKPGVLVVMKDDNTPPLKWKLGRIEQVYPGSDNVTRVVSVKTSNGTVVRAVQKICVLPVDT